MTLSEFKAWFEGFTENLDGPPNKKQWARIQKRVGEITGISGIQYIDRYVYPSTVPYWPVYQPTITCGSSTNITASDCVPIHNAGYVAASFATLGQAEAMEIEATA